MPQRPPEEAARQRLSYSAKRTIHCASGRTPPRCAMAAPKDLVSFHSDENFRKGACHGAHWIVETADTLAAQGRSAADINTHLSDLADVLAEWRSQTTVLPDGNPWDRSYKDLASVIKTLAKE